MTRPPTFIPLPDYHEYPVEAMSRRAAEFYGDVRRRRTVRDFSSRPVPRTIVEDCLRAAGTAPNGANMQPWHFVAVSDPAIKKKIRVEAEKEERSSTATRRRGNGSTLSLLSAPTSASRSSKRRRISSSSSPRATASCRTAAK